MSSALNPTVMPSESSFKKQAELASDSLKNFTAVQDLKSSAVIKAAMTELIDATVLFNNFVPFFVSHPLFQEVPSAVFNVLKKFSAKHPSFDMPQTMAKIAGLDARVKDSMSLKKGFFLFLFMFSLLNLFLFLRDRFSIRTAF
jgi:hypothetical protein